MTQTSRLPVPGRIRGMWRLRTLFRPQAENLEAHVQRAGLALACSYSTSDEYVSDVIAAQRAAGVYGPKRRLLVLSWAALAAAAVVLVALAI